MVRIVDGVALARDHPAPLPSSAASGVTRRMRSLDEPVAREWSGQAEWMRFARLTHRPGRVGGPAVRAASGANLSLT